MTPDEYCQDRTHRSGSSFYYSFLFLPPDKRRALNALYAFCREVDDVVDECRDPGVARTKLAWWRTEIAAAYDNRAQHPVTQALSRVVREYDLPQEQFQEIIDGMEMDLEQNRYPDFKDLQLYCYRVASVVGLLAAGIFGYNDHRTQRYAHDLGIAFQLTNILRDVGEDARRGRIYLPQDEMAQFGVSEDQLLLRDTGDNLRQLLKFQADRARTYYNAAFNRLPEQDRYAQRFGLIMAAIYLATLDEIEAREFPVLSQRVSLSPWRKLWIAWRTARREAGRARRKP